MSDNIYYVTFYCVLAVTVTRLKTYGLVGSCQYIGISDIVEYGRLTLDPLQWIAKVLGVSTFLSERWNLITTKKPMYQKHKGQFDKLRFTVVLVCCKFFDFFMDPSPKIKKCNTVLYCQHV